MALVEFLTSTVLLALSGFIQRFHLCWHYKASKPPDNMT